MTDRSHIAADRLAEAGRAAATRRAYASDWADFDRWCAEVGEMALPATPDSIARYLAERAATLKTATLERRLAALVDVHRQHGHGLDPKHPAIARVRAGIRRTLGAAAAQKDALGAEELRRIVATLPPTLAGTRDRALLLLGFAGAFRRSELAALDRRDLVWTGDGGVAVIVRRAKEDQDGKGAIKGIAPGSSPATCPVQAVKDWLLAARLDEGALFRAVDCHGNIGPRLGGTAIARLIKRAVAHAGRCEGALPAEVREAAARVSGHSLRSGFVTSAAEAGMTELEIMDVTGHKRADTVRRYVRMNRTIQAGITRRVGL